MDDYISRQDAINALENTDCELLSEEWDMLTDSIMCVPAAPVREMKRGRWIGIDDEPHETWECDQCGFIEECFDGDQWKFCPNCGADLREDA